jgi:hypothetical protein
MVAKKTETKQILQRTPVFFLSNELQLAQIIDLEAEKCI